MTKPNRPDRVALLAFAALVVCSMSGVGCARPGDELAGVTAVSASISGYEEVQVATLAGGVWASGLLTITDDNGGTHSVDVGIGGPVLGMVFDFHALEEDAFWDGSGGASLDIPEGGVDVPDLFEPYTGSGASAAIGLGGGLHTLSNEPGVELEAGGLWAGVGMMVGFEWFSMTPEGELR